MRRRAIIANVHPGGLWWKVPVALLVWLLWAAPTVGVVLGICTLREYARDLPTAPQLDRWLSFAPQTTLIVAADGTRVAEIPFTSGDEVGHRFTVRYEDVPQRVVEAVLAAEDVRFFEHHGVDARSVVRAALANYRAGKIVEGASTITQQVARNLLPQKIGHERSARRKVREALLARRIEQQYSKQKIFETYVNHAFLGESSYGVAAAARAYFDKPLAKLTLSEAALIAGMAQAPGRANPFSNLEAAKARRDDVIDRMSRAGFISELAASQALADPIALSPPPVRYGTVAPWHTERARREVELAFPLPYQHGGLRIETAAAPALSFSSQQQARAWSEQLGDGREHGAPQLAAVVWDHVTGYIEASVGGVRWQDSQYDRVTMACRQPGSAFKPVVYGAALSHNTITPGTPLRDAPIAEYDERLDVHWKPQSSGHAFRGVVLAHDALAASLNPPAVDVLDRTGAERVIAFARRVGITSDLADVRPLALGASCVIPIELAGVFAAIARRGVGVQPVFVVRVVRGDEVLLDRASPLDPTLDAARRLDRLAAVAGANEETVIEPATAFLLTAMLRDVVRRGTAMAARSIGRDAAGKTGTTNGNTDAWFVGFTGRVTVSVWVGHDDPSRTLGPRDDGARAAIPLWKRLVELAEATRRPVGLPGDPPAEVVQARVDRETGLLASPGAGGAIDLFFKQGTEPTQRAGHVPGVPTTLKRVTREF